MKTKEHTAATIRSIIRWIAGVTTTATIMTVASMLFPLLSSIPAFALVSCLSLFIGLQIALPPVDEEDDWVPVRAKVNNTEVREDATVVYFPSENRRAV